MFIFIMCVYNLNDELAIPNVNTYIPPRNLMFIKEIIMPTNG